MKFSSVLSARLWIFPLVLVLFSGRPVVVEAHPVPDIPVWSFFNQNGSCKIEVQVDTRCFSEDPLNEPYLLNWVLKEMPDAEKQALLKQAAELVKKSIRFRFEPSGDLEPVFKFEFLTHDMSPLEKDDDPVMVSGHWSAPQPAEVTGYQIEALPEGELSVLYINHIGEAAVKRFQVLFPGETSYLLDLEHPPELVEPAAIPKTAPPQEEAHSGPSGDDITLPKEEAKRSLLMGGYLTVVAIVVALLVMIIFAALIVLFVVRKRRGSEMSS